MTDTFLCLPDIKPLGIKESRSEMKKAAVTLDKAVVCYGRNIILSNLSMRVRQGTVYALLGPSGCGKTTLLSCILGRKYLQSGTITVYGGRPGDRTLGLPGHLVGYMPQDICLYQEFTIKETFQYFGRLQKMGSDSLEKRKLLLLEMLDLPEEGRRVSKLSGGQKRRLSFAVALLHNPRLLILDEPTVGVDPLVRARVWSHLLSLAVSGVTILITTHYVEEARGADTVGFMREGKLIAEGSPDKLMEMFNAPSLEKVFLALCQEQENGQIVEHENVTNSSQSLQSITINGDDCQQLIKMKTKENAKLSAGIPSLSNIAALSIKNWITMKRNLPLLLFVFFLPGLVLLINSVTVGLSPRNLPIAVVNKEDSCADLYYQSNCEAGQLGCYFQDSLNSSETILLIPYTDRDQAILDSQAGEVRGYVEIPPNFSTSFLKRVLDTIQYEEFLYFYNIENEEEVSINEKVSISLDSSDPQLALFIKKAISTSVDEFAKYLSRICKDDLGDNLDLSMIRMEDPTLGGDDTDFREFITPGMIALSIFFLAMALTSESFIAERSQGMLERSWITGVLPVEILSSYILSQFLVVVVQATITLITVFLIFQLPCRGPLTWFIILTLFQGLVGMSFGLFLSVVCNTSMDAMKMSVGSCFPLMLLSGIIWPLEAMPYTWLMSIAWYLPHTASVQGMRDIMLRGWGVHGSSVVQGIVLSAGWTAVFMGISWLLVRHKLK